MFRFVFCVGLISVSQLLAQQTFECPGSSFTVAEGINNSGTVAGYYYDSTNAAHGFTYSGGTCFPFTIPNGVNTFAIAINDSGTVTGYFVDASNMTHGFTRTSGGAVTVLDYISTTSNTVGLDINGSGNVLLDSSQSSGSGVALFNGSTYTAVNFSHSILAYSKMGINDALNTIVGTVPNSNGPSCFIDAYPSGTSSTFAVSNATSTFCFDVNNSGAISGAYIANGNEFAFVRVGSNVITIQGLSGAAANGLNDMNQVVGSYVTSTGSTAAFIANYATSGVRGDFDHNGVPDVVWENDSTFQVALWLMGGAQGSQFQTFLYIDQMGEPNWSVVTLADMNRDGVPDLIWQNNINGEAVIWYMGGTDGSQEISSAFIQSSPLANWKIVSVNDLNGDGVPDVLWQNMSNAQVAVWYMGGAGGNQFQSFQLCNFTAPTGWNIVGTADLDLDGHPDIVWQNTTTRQAVVWYMGGANGIQFLNWAWLQQNTNTPTWKIVGLTDQNGDGHPDLIWQEDSTREVVAWFLSGTQGNQTTGAAFLAGQTTGWRALSAH